jgi:hypothetical protein
MNMAVPVQEGSGAASVAMRSCAKAEYKIISIDNSVDKFHKYFGSLHAFSCYKRSTRQKDNGIS